MNYDKSLLLLESVYTKFIAGEIDEKKLCKDISTALETIPFSKSDKDFIVEISNKKKSEKFFGFRIFPNIEKLESFCKDIVEDDSKKTLSFSEISKRWKTIDYWVLEIDANTFDRNLINFTPKELVAMTLHEIGHIIYSDEPIEAFYRSYQEAKVQLTTAQKSTQKLMYSIYMVPLSIACMQRRWIGGEDALKVEVIADRTVSEIGYGDYLVSALNKIIKVFGTTVADTGAYYKTIDTSVKWCTMNVADVIKRKNTLKDDLFYQGLKSRSNYFKAVSVLILDVLGFKMREKYTGSAVEATIGLLSEDGVLERYDMIVDKIKFAKFEVLYNTLHNANEASLESLVPFNTLVKDALPSKSDLDILALEVDKITTTQDKAFVLDLIYNAMDKVSIFEESVNKDPKIYCQWSEKVSNIKNTLEELRQTTINRIVMDNVYQFISYNKKDDELDYNP